MVFQQPCSVFVRSSVVVASGAGGVVTGTMVMPSGLELTMVGVDVTVATAVAVDGVAVTTAVATADEITLVSAGVAVVARIGLGMRALLIEDIAAWIELSAAASMIVEVGVGPGGRVEPEASTVISLMLLTVLRCGTSERMSVEVAAPGFSVNELVVELDEVIELVVDVVKVLIMLIRFDAMAAASDEGLIVLVVDVPELLLLVVDVLLGSSSDKAPAPGEVTVTVTGAWACGMTKFGEMLIAGCLSCASQLHAGPFVPTSLNGRLLYSPMTV